MRRCQKERHVGQSFADERSAEALSRLHSANERVKNRSITSGRRSVWKTASNFSVNFRSTGYKIISEPSFVCCRDVRPVHRLAAAAWRRVQSANFKSAREWCRDIIARYNCAQLCIGREKRRSELQEHIKHNSTLCITHMQSHAERFENVNSSLRAPRVYFWAELFDLSRAARTVLNYIVTQRNDAVIKTSQNMLFGREKHRSYLYYI